MQLKLLSKMGPKSIFMITTFSLKLCISQLFKNTPLSLAEYFKKEPIITFLKAHSNEPKELISH